MTDNGSVKPFVEKAVAAITGARAVLAVLGVSFAVVVWTVRQESNIIELQKQTAVDEAHVTGLDSAERATSERVMLLIEHLNEDERAAVATNEAVAKRLQDVGNRLTDMEPLIRKIDVLSTRDDEIFRRLDRIEAEMRLVRDLLIKSDIYHRPETNK